MKNGKEVWQALEKAQDTLDDSQFLLDAGRNIVTVNRAYYAMYYSISALLYSEGVYAKTHTGAITKYEELFVKTGIFSTDTSAWIRNAFNLRQEADYDLEAEIDEQEATILVETAQNLFDRVKLYLQSIE